MKRNDFIKRIGLLFSAGLIAPKLLKAETDWYNEPIVSKDDYTTHGEWLNDYDPFTEECDCEHDWILKGEEVTDIIPVAYYLCSTCSKCSAFKMEIVKTDEQWISWQRLRIEHLKRVGIIKPYETMESLSKEFMKEVIKRQ